MLYFQMTPFQLAWSWFKGKKNTIAEKPSVFACPDCAMPIDEQMQQTNVRVEQVDSVECYILSCLWCHRVLNIGEKEKVDKKFTIQHMEIKQ